MKFRVSVRISPELSTNLPEEGYSRYMKEAISNQLSRDIVSKLEILKEPENWTNQQLYSVEGFLFSTKAMNDMLLEVSEKLYSYFSVSESERVEILRIIKSYDNKL